MTNPNRRKSQTLPSRLIARIPRREWEVWSQVRRAGRCYTRAGARRQARELNRHVPASSDLRFAVVHTSSRGPAPARDASPLRLYLAGGGDLSTPRVAALMAEAARGDRRLSARS